MGITWMGHSKTSISETTVPESVQGYITYDWLDSVYVFRNSNNHAMMCKDLRPLSFNGVRSTVSDNRILG